MPQDLREFLRQAGEPTAVVSRRVSPKFEIPTILELLEKEKRFPMVLFNQVDDTRGEPAAFRVLANAFADRARLARFFGCTPQELPLKYLERAAVRPPVRLVEDAPVQKNRHTGDDVRLTHLPVVTHNEKDAGPYLTSGAVILKDPETGIVNGAIQRMQLKGDRRLGLFMVPNGHNAQIFAKYKARGQNAPCAIVLGHHPAFFMAMQHKGTMDDSEYEVAGGMLGEPLEVARTLTQPNLEIPTHAEIIIEGEILHDLLEDEGPFGEYTHYYSPMRQSHVIHVTGLTFRDDAIFHDIFACHRDHHFLEGIVMESQLREILQRDHPGVQNLYLPPSGCCQFFCYVALAKSTDAEPRQVIDAILQANVWVKYVIVVDPDIDVFDESEVLWAVATRVRASEDYVPFTGATGTAMDPTAKDGVPERGGIDATLPADGSFPERVALPKSVLAGLSLRDYDL
jgi:2,5-furandicarboxylate decarboxylase 1